MVVVRDTTASITLEVEIQADNVVEPMRGQIQDLPRFQDDFIGLGLGKFRKALEIGVGVIDFGMTRRFVVFR